MAAKRKSKSDVVTEMTRMWTDLRKELDVVNEGSSEAEIERFLDRVVVLRGVEMQTLFPALEEVDDDSDAATAKATKRSNAIQKALEKLRLPPSAKLWQVFARTIFTHLDASPKDVGKRLAALSPEDRADLGEQVRAAYETLS